MKVGERMHKHSLEDAVKLLRENGIRITPQREAIIKYLIHLDGHPTVEEIYQGVSKELGGMSLATVYNNLKVLVDAGLVDEMKFNGITSRYDYNHHLHYHAVCVECGEIYDFNYDDVSPIMEAAAQQTGFDVYHLRIEAHGLCPHCKGKINESDSVV